jgi:CRP-like cAMP-binding protein
MSDPATLSNMLVFRDVPRRALSELCILAPPVQFPIGALVFEQGMTADVALLLIEGKLNVEVHGAGQPRQLGQVHPGEIVGEQALFSRGGERSATVKAGQASSCLLLSAEVMEKASTNPAVIAIERQLLATLARRIRGTNQEIQKVWKEASELAPPEDKKTLTTRLRGLFGGRG